MEVIIVIGFPSDTSEKSIFSFCDEIESNAGEEQIIIDFSKMGRIEPFTMVYVAKFIR